jgi:hypothetical protein
MIGLVWWNRQSAVMRGSCRLKSLGVGSEQIEHLQKHDMRRNDMPKISECFWGCSYEKKSRSRPRDLRKIARFCGLFDPFWALSHKSGTEENIFIRILILRGTFLNGIELWSPLFVSYWPIGESALRLGIV